VSVNSIQKLRRRQSRAVFRRPDVPSIKPNLLLAARLESEQQVVAGDILTKIVARERMKRHVPDAAA
jgi:hypothetical protein